jgi:hypothetical protein
VDVISNEPNEASQEDEEIPQEATPINPHVLQSRTITYTYEEYRQENPPNTTPLGPTVDKSKTGYAIIGGIAVDALDAQLFLEDWNVIHSQMAMTLKDIAEYNLDDRKNDPNYPDDAAMGVMSERFIRHEMRSSLEPLATGKATDDEKSRVRVMDGIGQRHISIVEKVRQMEEPSFVVSKSHKIVWGNFSFFCGNSWRKIRNWLGHEYTRYIGHGRLDVWHPRSQEELYRELYVLYTQGISRANTIIEALKEALEDESRWFEYTPLPSELKQGWPDSDSMTEAVPETMSEEPETQKRSTKPGIMMKVFLPLFSLFTFLYYQSNWVRRQCNDIRYSFQELNAKFSMDESQRLAD